MPTHLSRSRRHARPARYASVALFVSVWAGPAAADLVGFSAEHEFRLTTQQPFDTSNTTDFTSGLTNGVATYVNTETLSPGSDTSAASQDITVTANRITAALQASTQSAGSIASANFEGSFTLDAATTLTASGSANGGFGAFSGGSSLTLVPDGEPFANAIIAITGADGINYGGGLGPFALAAGAYDFKISTSLAGGAIGTRFHNVNLQFGASAAVTGDHNGTGQVEQGDLDLVLQNWGLDTDTAGVPAGWTNTDDLNGQIEQTELDAILQNWGSTTAPDFAGHAHLPGVPEPATALLLTLSGAVRMRRHPR